MTAHAPQQSTEDALCKVTAGKRVTAMPMWVGVGHVWMDFIEFKYLLSLYLKVSTVEACRHNCFG